MRIIILIVRILLGLLLLFASISYFLQLAPQPVLTGNMKTFNDGLNASSYIMPMVKAIELVCGISFVIGKFNKLTYILLMPISINIFCTHLFLAPEGLPIASFVLLGNLYLINSKWGSYKGLFTAN